MPRAQHIQIRVSDEEKALLQAAAQQAGLGLSEYIRRETGLGKFRRADLRQLRQTPDERKPPSVQVAPDREQRVRGAALRMPRSAAEKVVSREEARERAEALLGG